VDGIPPDSKKLFPSNGSVVDRPCKLEALSPAILKLRLLSDDIFYICATYLSSTISLREGFGAIYGLPREILPPCSPSLLCKLTSMFNHRSTKDQGYTLHGSAELDSWNAAPLSGKLPRAVTTSPLRKTMRRL
jgi:hypothetical protein